MEVQHWLASVDSGEHAYNFEGMAGQVRESIGTRASQHFLAHTAEIR